MEPELSARRAEFLLNRCARSWPIRELEGCTVSQQWIEPELHKDDGSVSSGIGVEPFFAGTGVVLGILVVRVCAIPVDPMLLVVTVCVIPVDPMLLVVTVCVIPVDPMLPVVGG